MSNKEFYDLLLQYEHEGKVIFMPRVLPSRFYKVLVGKRHIAVNMDIFEFGKEIEDKLFSQQTLEQHIGKSNSVVKRMIAEGEYIRITRSTFKFYIKKDWE